MRRLAIPMLALAACGGAAEPDASLATDGGAAFVEPLAPSPPQMTPCPPGWSPRDSGEGFELCDPPEGPACPAGTERFLDAIECVPVGDPCPAGEWAEPPAGAPAVYVRAGTTGGDGTPAAPYGSIQAAIVRAPPGAAVMVARGTYDETIDVYGGLRVVGACATETVLAPRAGAVAVRAAERGSAIANVTVRPAGDQVGVAVTGELSLRGVVIEGAADDAIYVLKGGRLDAEAIVVRDVRALRPSYGRALTVHRAAATVSRAIFERCAGAAILASEGATLSARAVAVRRCDDPLRRDGQVISQGAGATLDLSESLVEEASDAAIFTNEGGLVRARDVVLRRMRADVASGGSAAGVLARSGARFEGSRVRIEDVDFTGVLVLEDATLSLEDSLVARVAHTLLDTVPVAFGALVSGPGATLRRVAIRDVERIGVQAERATLVLEDVSVARIGSVSHPEFTSAGMVQLAGHTSALRRVAFIDLRGGGLLARESDLALEDVLVRDVAGIEDGRFGRGIELGGGTGALSRVLVDRSREIGVHATEDARLALAGVRVTDTLGRDCRDTTCPDTPGGIGLAAVGAAIDARDFEVDGARLCGAMVALEGELHLRRGEIRGATVGACVQVDGYDLTRLTSDVRYRDNGVHVDTTDHVVPTPANPLESTGL